MGCAFCPPIRYPKGIQADTNTKAPLYILGGLGIAGLLYVLLKSKRG